jgi:protein-disulfide isomerase
VPPTPGPPKSRAPSSTRSRKVWLILGGALAIAAVLIGISVASGRESKAKTADADVIAMLAGIPQNGSYLGSPAAPVALIEYNDEQCPYCKQYSDDVLPDLVDSYVVPGKVRLQVVPFPILGPDSVKAARYVVAAQNQNKAWQVSELLFANQGPENGGWVTDDLLTKIGNTIPGLDIDRWKQDARSTAVAKQVDANATRGQADGVASTPSFFIVQPPNKPEVFEPDALTPESFSARLNEALNQ